MSSDGVIAAEHIWKRFRADYRRLLLRDELERLRARVRGDALQGFRWVLRDVNIHAEPGESIGLIGANGSGKSTLLKVLTRVMYPYAGRLQVGGRVGALIEVRAGIHGDLTGRENIFLYGGLLGLPRRTIASRFDEIVDFAELNDAIDRQVKFYSTGMQMRLGFAVAAFLEPDILLVDEVLAVGDAAFQQRCLDRMRKVLAQGTTLVYVSHDLPTVEAVCRRSLWLDRGVVKADGPVREVLSAYRQAIEQTAESEPRVAGLVTLSQVRVSSEGGSALRTQMPLDFDLTVESPNGRTGRVVLGVSEGAATPIFLLGRDLQIAEGRTQLRCSLRRLPLPRGRFYLWVGIFAPGSVELLPWHPAKHFDVWGPDLDDPPSAVVRLTSVHVEAEWETSRSLL